MRVGGPEVRGVGQRHSPGNERRDVDRPNARTPHVLIRG